MASSPLPCFHADTLRQNFARQIALAHSERVLATTQAERFNTLCQHPWPNSLELTISRLDCAALNGNPEFADALMMVENGVKTTEVYLCLPLCAIERFPSRLRLDEVLRKRYGTDVPAETAIEEYPLATSIFEYWMGNLLDRQEDHLQNLDRDLLALPTLQGVLRNTLQNTLEREAPDQPSDPEQWAYQATQPSAPETITHTRSLVEAAMDEFCSVEPPTATELSLLPPDGSTLPAGVQFALQNAIRDAVAALAGRYDMALAAYWAQPLEPGVSREQHAVSALLHRYYLALLSLQEHAQTTPQEISWLRKALRADLGAANGALSLSRVTLQSVPGSVITVAGALVLSDQSPAPGPFFLFTAREGLVRLADVPALTAWLVASPQKELLQEAIGRDNQAPFNAMKDPEARLIGMAEPPFAERMKSILAVQRRNLSIAIAQRGQTPDEVAVRLDDAIDVRGLLAPSLLQLDQSPRWSTGDSTEPAADVEVKPATRTTAFGRILDLQARFSLIQEAVPTLETCLRHLLDLRLALLDDRHLNATSVWISRTSLTGEKNRDTLLVVAMEHLSRTPPAALTVEDGVTGVDGQALGRLDHTLLNRWLQAITAQVKGHWIVQFHRFNQQPTRLGTFQIDAHRDSLAIRQQALREELAMESKVPDNDLWAQQWLTQALDRPRRAMRLVLGDAAVECQQITVHLPQVDFAIPFSNVAVLTQVVAPQGLLLFCSHRFGLMTFDDVGELSMELNRLLDAPTGREQWLKLFAERHQPLLRSHLETEGHAPLEIKLNPSEDGITHTLQRGDEVRQIFSAEAAFVNARKGDYPPALWLAYVDEIASGLRLGDQLDEQTQALRGEILDQALPRWLGRASDADLNLYNHNLERVRQCLAMPQRFLFGVETATEFATQQVQTSLVLDFPEASVDIENVRVRVREKFKAGIHFSGATEGLATGSDGIAFPTLELSLVQYTLHRFIAQPGLPIEVRMADDSPLLDGLDAKYVAQMAERLDTGGHYLRHLRQLFSPLHLDYTKRLALFREQTPAILMDAAIEGKLKKNLSDEAYGIIEAFIDMPDPTARQLPNGHEYFLRPLCLLADEDLAPDPAAGLYLLGSKDEGKGPVVLLALYHDGFAYREYTSEAQLLETLRKPGDLQDLVLQRIAPDVHSRYANGGLLTPNFEVSAGPEPEQPEPQRKHTRLAFEPVSGNTMEYLLSESLAFLMRAAEAQVVTSQQADRAATVRLIELLGETGMTLLSGRLALVLSAWQTEQWFESAAESAARKDWGEALSKFIAALSTVLGHRLPRSQRMEPLPVAAAAAPAFSWRANAIPLHLKAVLGGFEARDIMLKELQRDHSSGLYDASTTQRTYAPVGGHVYEVKQRGAQWYIVDEGRQGPDIRRDATGHWELDLKWGLRGGGAGWSQQRAERKLQRIVAEDFITEAVGMPAIRQFSLTKALKIGAARLHAKQYLERCLDVLSPASGQQTLSLPVLDTLQKFFDVSPPTPHLIGAVKRQVGQIFGELMDASMNLHSSERYIIGRNRLGREAVLAFVDKKDPQRRIFLTDTFFSLPDQLRSSLRNSQRGFEVADHFRATTLIHELSHLANLTFDIAYVEASAPFLDLIDNTAPGPSGGSLLHDIKVFQQQTLTARTPLGHLFKTVENGAWRDISQSDGEGYAQVLRITGEKTLAGARTRFLSSEFVRSQVMLANADSVALLVTLLARHPLAAVPG
jgi:hypothetical protein